MKDKKKLTIIIISILIILCILGVTLFFLLNGNSNTNSKELKKLPRPEITGGVRGELGIDKNINEETIDDYLDRSDSVYRDMRMLEDPGNYEAIGGDRYLSGYVKGFEVVPLPYIIPVSGLPSEVGETYKGDTLFSYVDNKYVPNYEESMQIIETLFPKDKVIFLMCGGGGYAGMTKNFLVSLGWDESKIYNTGGYWYYKGKNNVEVKEIVNGKANYKFEIVPYHEIDFTKLTKKEGTIDKTVKVESVLISVNNKTMEEKTSYKLNAIVLPNEATDKEVTWSSSNDNIATVSNEGLVSAKKDGTVVITVTTKDGGKTATCKITVKKSETAEQIKLDDISNVIALLESNSVELPEIEFNRIVYTPEMEYKEGYYVYDEYGNKMPNEAWYEEHTKFKANQEKMYDKRAGILNTLADSKKSFIILLEEQLCEERDFPLSLRAYDILTERNIQFIRIADYVDQAYSRSTLKVPGYKSGTIVIYKEGKAYAYTDPEKYSFKNNEELINWLKKYIKIN